MVKCEGSTHVFSHLAFVLYSGTTIDKRLTDAGLDGPGEVIQGRIGRWGTDVGRNPDMRGRSDFVSEFTARSPLGWVSLTAAMRMSYLVRSSFNMQFNNCGIFGVLSRVCI